MIKYDDEIKNVLQVKEANLFFFSVSKKEVISKDYKRIINSLEILKETGREAKRKLFLVFDGYNDDKREIYEIPEIRDFVKDIYNKYKYLFYFLTTLDNNRSIIYACINNLEIIHNNNNPIVKFRIILNKEIERETTNAMLEYGTQIGETEMQREIFTFI